MPYKKKKKYLLQYVLMLAVLLGVAAAVYYFGIADQITFERLQLKSVELKHAVDENYMQALLLYTAVTMLLVTITLPVVGPLTMLGGYLFGLIPGFLASLFGAAIGSTLSFLIIRYALGSLIRNRYKTRLAKFNEKIKMYGTSYVLTLQLLSVIPYVVINTLAALTDVSTFTSFWTTLIGSIPLVFMYTLAGRQLGTMQSAADIFSGQFMLIILLLAMLALVPMIVRRFKKDAAFDEEEE
jgi:uncharacterized membrane protein YdjX (TVP38/TMEM64 family)